MFRIHKHFTFVANLPPPAGDKGGLGQLVKLADGTLLVTRFGFGVAGAIIQLKPDGTSSYVPNLDPARRRIGLAVAPDGTIFDTYFTPVANADMGSMTQIGAVAKVTLSGTETDVVTGLVKPVGVVISGGNLYISDQALGQIWKGPLSAPQTASMWATAMGVDLLTVGPAGDLFSGSKLGGTYRISSSATVTQFSTGTKATRGVAYDSQSKRLFVAVPDPAVPDAGSPAPTIVVLPVDN